MSRKRSELQSRIKRGFIQCDMVNPRKNSVTFNDNDAFLYSLDQLDQCNKITLDRKKLW